ncbi:cysteine dioxygenase [Desmospora profundinema]|uniref:Cysteine dioxygenase n=1 Tax=Desmospora profundinema TaxID=1571184 RepID=A0ABU1INQ8_9BACL|nr:cysteine dioxygenase family protein [Desmospora profundinema]MDR6226341.1 cysteine dioxygenase [Desmospora profundinema]
MDVMDGLKRSLQTQTQADCSYLRRVIEQIHCTFEKITPYITPPQPPLNYGRNIIFRTDLFEAIVLNLPGHTETPIHDHGESIGCVYVVSGTVLNKVCTIPSHLRVPVLSEEKRYQSGEFIHINRGQIHSMHNPEQERLISFHIYSPPLKGTNTYTLPSS